MANRLAELEQVLVRRRRRNHSIQNKPAAASFALRHRRPRISRAYAGIDYRIPGIVPGLSQPSARSCWATVFTMMYSWKNNVSISIAEALDTVDRRWREKFEGPERDQWLRANEKIDFLAQAGLVAEPPMNHTVAGWEQLLRDYGPIWVTTDERPGRPGGIHARVLIAISGDGTPSGTRLTFINPSHGGETSETVEEFLPKFEDEAQRIVDAGSNEPFRIQVVHWPRGARSPQSQSRSLPMSISNRRDSGRTTAGGFDAMDYSVPGAIDVIAQPTARTCWAAVFTMLYGWKNRICISIADAVATVDSRWAEKFRRGEPLFPQEKEAFVRQAGLAAEPPMSFSVDGWNRMLRAYGPLWVTTDEAPGPDEAYHARIITGIHGDATPQGTSFDLIDPAGGRRYQERVSDFVPKLEEEVRSTGRIRIQVLHWPAGATAQSFSLMRPGSRQSFALAYSTAVNAYRQAKSLEAINIRYNVELVPQQTGFSCWAAGCAMIIGWRDRVCIDPGEIARGAGYWEQYREALRMSTDIDELQFEDVQRFLTTFNMVPENPQTYTVEGFAQLLRNYGPLWVGSAEPGPHIRVITGMQGDGTPDGTRVFVNDPWQQGMTVFSPSNQGSRYTETYRQFVRKQSRLAVEANPPVVVAHLPSLPEWMNSPAAQSFSAYIRRPLAMESPSNPENFKLLQSGTWNGNTTLAVQGGQAMWFKIRNTNVLGTTITITDQAGQVRQSIILPLSNVEFVFSVFGPEPMGWRFSIRTQSSAFMVTWELWSTWVPGDPPNG